MRGAGNSDPPEPLGEVNIIHQVINRWDTHSPSQHSAPSLSVNSLFWKAWCIIQHKSVKIWEQPLASQARLPPPPAAFHGCHRLGRERDGHPPPKKNCVWMLLEVCSSSSHVNTSSQEERKKAWTHVWKQIIKSIIRYTTSTFVLKVGGCTWRSDKHLVCDSTNEHKKCLKRQLWRSFTGEVI